MRSICSNRPCNIWFPNTVKALGITRRFSAIASRPLQLACPSRRSHTAELTLQNNLHVSDATLLRRIRRGDSVAFAELSRKHEPKILAVSRRILKNREDAEDNAQSTFMRAYFHCGQFRGASQFSTWLVRVAINEALMRLRRRKSHKEVSLNSDAANNEDPLPVRDVSSEIRHIQQKSLYGPSDTTCSAKALYPLSNISCMDLSTFSPSILLQDSQQGILNCPYRNRV